MYRTALVITLLAATGLPVPAIAGNDQEAALKAGAIQLTSDEIARLLVGKTVKARAGKKKFLFYYSKDNVLSGRMIGGKWSDRGYYGITDDNRVCISMTKDKGRLRCLTLLKSAGRIMKFNRVGKMTFDLLEFTTGNRLAD